MKFRHLAVVLPLALAGTSAAAYAQGRPTLAEPAYAEPMKPVYAPTLDREIDKTSLHLPIPKSRSRLVFDSDEYNRHYAAQLADISAALDNAANKDFQRFENALGLLSNSLTPPSGTEQSCDLMFKVVYLLQAKGLVDFTGTEAQWGKEQVAFSSLDQIPEASKTDAGRTWLTGVVQNWMYELVPALHAQGYMSVEQAAEILVFARKDTRYNQGRFLEEQNQFLKVLAQAIKSGDKKILEAAVAKARNPVDHEDVNQRTGGRGWMAFGKTTIRFFMLVAKEEIVKEADPVPSPPVPKVIELPSHRQKEPIKEPPLNDIPMTGVSTMLIHGKTGQAYTQEEIEQLKETHYISYLWLSYRNVKLNDGSSVIMIVDPSLPSPGEADKLYVPYNSFLGKDGQVYLLDREKFVENITGRGPSQPIPKLNSDGMPIVLGRLKLENGKLVLDSESVSSPGIRDNCIQTNLTPDAVFRTAIFRGSAGSTDLNSEQIFSAFIYLLEKPSQLPSAPVQFDTKSRTGGLIDAGGEL